MSEATNANPNAKQNPHRIIEPPPMTEIEKARDKATEVIGQKPPKTAYQKERAKYNSRGVLIDAEEIEKEQRLRDVLLGNTKPEKDDFESENFWKAQQSGTNLPSSGQLPPTTRNDVQPVPVHVQVAAILELPEDVQNLDENGAMFTVTPDQVDKQLEVWQNSAKEKAGESSEPKTDGTEPNGDGSTNDPSDPGNQQSSAAPSLEGTVPMTEGKPAESGSVIEETANTEPITMEAKEQPDQVQETPVVDPEQIKTDEVSVEPIKTEETVQDASESAPETNETIPKNKRK